MRANAPQLPRGGGGMGAAGIDWCINVEYLWKSLSLTLSPRTLFCHCISFLFSTVESNSCSFISKAVVIVLLQCGKHSQDWCEEQNGIKITHFCNVTFERPNIP